MNEFIFEIEDVRVVWSCNGVEIHFECVFRVILKLSHKTYKIAFKKTSGLPYDTIHLHTRQY